MTMEVSFFLELIAKKLEAKQQETLKMVEYNEHNRAQVALGGMKACDELRREVEIHLDAIQRAVRRDHDKHAKREERLRLRRLHKQAAKEQVA